MIVSWKSNSTISNSDCTQRPKMGDEMNNKKDYVFGIPAQDFSKQYFDDLHLTVKSCSGFDCIGSTTTSFLLCGSVCFIE